MVNSDEKTNFRRRSPVSVDDCSMAMAIDLIGDRWSLLIMREALYGVAKFEDIRADINIPKSVLSTRLRKLVEGGILEKQPYREAGSRMRQAYVPTEKGRELGLVMLTLMQWGDRHLRDDTGPLALFDKESRRSVRTALVSDMGREISIENLKMVLKSGAS